jgi:hypothetical protein
MPTAVTLRDWVYVALVAAALVTYGASLASQALAAPDNGVRICAFSEAADTKAN